jgi:hypothetical protein
LCIAETLLELAGRLLQAEEEIVMNEETVIPVEGPLPPVVVDAKPPRTRSPFDVEAIKKLALAESVAFAAQRPECSAPLLEREITAQQISTLLGDIQACRTKIAQAMSGHGLSKDATTIESDNKTLLLQKLSDIHSAALQKWSGKPTHRGDLDTYGIGQKLRDFSRPALETMVKGILQRVSTDALPGVNAAKIASLQSTFDAWKAADQSQTTHGTDAALLLAEAKKELKSITSRRIELQHAADGAFPHHSETLAPLRADFKLPKTRPYRAGKR